jgi:hypothetical protein
VSKSLFARKCVLCPSVTPSCPSCPTGSKCSISVQTCDTCQTTSCIVDPTAAVTPSNPDTPAVDWGSSHPNIGAIVGGVIGGFRLLSTLRGEGSVRGGTYGAIYQTGGGFREGFHTKTGRACLHLYSRLYRFYRANQSLQHYPDCIHSRCYKQISALDARPPCPAGATYPYFPIQRKHSELRGRTLLHAWLCVTD